MSANLGELSWIRFIVDIFEYVGLVVSVYMQHVG